MQFRDEEIAEKAVMDLNNRWYNGESIDMHYVCTYVLTFFMCTDLWREAQAKQ